jgi:hypothetical protein
MDGHDLVADGLLIQQRVDHDTQPGQALAHLRPQLNVMFANATAEGQHVQPTQTSDQRARFAHRPIGE